MSLTAYPPLPVTARRDFAFRVPDPEGAPSSNGSRYHSAVDWFSPAGTTVHAPRGGKVIESRDTGDISGQVFGGTVKIQDAEGRVWAMRHVVPTVGLGRTVDTGDPVATVSQWLDWPGGTHCHMEIWKSLSGGYRHENMLDPASVEWSETTDDKPAYFFEEMPWDQGGLGPRIIGQKAGYAKAPLAHAVAALHRSQGRAISTVRGEDDRTYVLWWAPKTYGRRFRFGPWASKDGRDELRADYQRNQGREVRPFSGRARSIYPWPKTA